MSSYTYYDVLNVGDFFYFSDAIVKQYPVSFGVCIKINKDTYFNDKYRACHIPIVLLQKNKEFVSVWKTPPFPNCMEIYHI